MSSISSGMNVHHLPGCALSIRARPSHTRPQLHSGRDALRSRALSERVDGGGSSWNAVEKGGGTGNGADYLSELGKRQNYNINVEHGQSSTHIDSLFTGNVLGHKSDIADGSLRYENFRTLNNIVGDFYVSPRYVERVAMHIVKNFLASDLKVNVPLVLGIWGGKGQGKSFQLELAFKKMGVEPIIMSAGEMEDVTAGMPGMLIRERYAKAAMMCKNQGKLSCLVINDIDAGVGRFANTQVTVNNQIVTGTLMSLCDSPAFIPMGEAWNDLENKESKRLNRIPIIVTGNDLSTLFAPMTRDGRMDKFYWQPTEEELLMTVWSMYKEDGLTREEMETLMKEFPNQSLDFYGAIRQATYDDVVLKWILKQVGGVSTTAEARPEQLAVLTDQLVKRPIDAVGGRKAWDEVEPGKTFMRGFDTSDLERPPVSLESLLEQGRRLVEEQDNINSIKLASEYMNKFHAKGGRPMIGLMG